MLTSGNERGVCVFVFWGMEILGGTMMEKEGSSDMRDFSLERGLLMNQQPHLGLLSLSFSPCLTHTSSSELVNPTSLSTYLID